MAQKETQFAEGIYFDPPRENAPGYVLGRISMRREQVIAWLETFDKEWVRVDVQMSKGGKPYCKLDTYEKGQNGTASASGTVPAVTKPTKVNRPAIAPPGTVATEDQIEYPLDDINPDDIPF